MGNSKDRKENHVRISLSEESQFKEKTAGFERYDFLHYAASELREEDVILKTDFFGREISSPFLIASMTGGYGDAFNINSMLAEAAEELNIPIGVGSQRVMLEEDSLIPTFSIVRKKAPNIPVIANIGAAEFVKFENLDPLNKMIDVIEADAVFVHLNLLQEMLQMGGNPDFKGLIQKIRKFSNELDVPLIVKEVGFGISKEAAKNLLEAGAKGIDVAGAGGTSWSRIEQIRTEKDPSPFSEWGLPTSYCVRTVAELKKDFDFVLIASGGINDSFSYAKSLALGANITSAARSILKSVVERGSEGVIELVQNLNKDLVKIMILTNSKKTNELKEKLILKEELF